MSKYHSTGSAEPRSGSETRTTFLVSDSECQAGSHPKGGKAVSVGEERALQKWTAERLTERHGEVIE